jgi:hypothetical protein
MATQTKIMDMTGTIHRNMDNLANLFQQRHFYAPIPKDKIDAISNYRWHSKSNWREVGENLACAMIAAETNMPAQVKVRTDKALEAFDTDRVEKSLAWAKKFNPKAKLFAVTESLNFPIIVNGKDFIWEGRLLNKMHSHQRSDQLIPKNVMKHVKYLRNNGLTFEDGFALFWPRKAYESAKKDIIGDQIGSLKKDLSMITSKIGSALRSGRERGAQLVNRTLNYIHPPAPVHHDPVLTGIIAGSLDNRKYFLVEVGRWIDTY